MKGTEKIIAHIQADAKAQVDAILAQAEQQCAEIRAGYEKQAADRYSDRIRAGVKACQDEVDSRARIDQMEARKGTLAVKQEMVSEAFDKALEALVALPEDEYVAFLASLAANAAVSREEEIILNARDRAAIGQKVVEAANTRLGSGKLTLAKETGDFAGGLILRRGNVEANCTAELLVELQRGEMSAEIAGLLFA
jgi:V/A-type H+-transporting ATPase subunit E